MSSSLPSEVIDQAATFIEERCQNDLAMMVDRGDERLTIKWTDLYSHNPALAEDILDRPERMFEALEAGMEQAELDAMFESVFDDNIDREDVEFVITDLAERKQPIAHLRWDDVGRYVSIESQVEMRTQVEPYLKVAFFECQNCGHSLRMKQAGEEIQYPYKCESCEAQKQWDINQKQSLWSDQQIIEIADPPEESMGRSDSIVVEAYNDLTGKVEAGDRVIVNGILETKSIVDESNPKRRRPLRMKARALEKTVSGYEDITPERVSEIKELAEDDALFDKLIDSLAPHILTGERGNMIKLSVMLQLFGGVEVDLNAGFKRGNLNILLIGEPGTAKSQFLGAANRIAPKSVKVSGKNARPAGMTATAVQSEHTGEWTLKAGALVKASGGLACIDEFDKMRGETISSLHEALEDQSISVAKADINTTVPAKAAVLAAANPEAGYFDRFEKVSDQIEIGAAIISRFDLMFGMEDVVDEERDRETAYHQHETGDPGHDEVPPAIDHDLLTEYIAYARQNISPRYEGTAAKDRLVDYYVEKRQEAVNATDETIKPVGPRVNETLRRIAQASARARLSGAVEMEDAERAIGLFNRTIGEVGLTEDGVVDGSKLDGGYGRVTQKQAVRYVMGAVRDLEGDYDAGVPEDAIVKRAKKEGVETNRSLNIIENMMKEGDLTEPKTNHYRET